MSGCIRRLLPTIARHLHSQEMSTLITNLPPSAELQLVQRSIISLLPSARTFHHNASLYAVDQPAENVDALQLSDNAVVRLRELQSQTPDQPVVLRLMVEGGGCSGFQYSFSIDSAPADGDRVFERDGVKLVCDDVSLEFLKGATIDFESDLMKSAFVVQDNPNAAQGCGCGSSFSVDK